MEASGKKVFALFDGFKTNVTPLFQRSFSWKAKDWTGFLDDILEVFNYEDKKAHYFIGSFVLTKPSEDQEDEGSVPEYLIIDGQQRMTTLYLIFLILRDRLKTIGQDGRAAQIENVVLVNSSVDKAESYYKLLPTQVDREPLSELVSGKRSKRESVLFEAYNSLRKKILKEIPDDKMYELYNFIRNRVDIVEILLDAGDNYYEIFESLNNKGTPLTQADLIRNYIFMEIPHTKQQELYDSYWLPMEEVIDKDLTGYFYNWLGSTGRYTGKKNIAESVRNYLQEYKSKGFTPMEFLKLIKEDSDLYADILFPENRIADQTIRSQVMRVNSLGPNTLNTVLLFFYKELKQGAITQEKFLTVLDSLENYIIRKFLKGDGGKNYNQFFPQLISEYKSSGKDKSISSMLINKQYPDDAVLRVSAKTANHYKSNPGLTHFVLTQLENSFGNPEVLNTLDLQIDHVFPQEPESDYHKELDTNEMASIRSTYLHNLGNLTLITGESNNKSSNALYSVKQKELIRSRLNLNQYFKKTSKWDSNEITKRLDDLIDRLIVLYPYFGNSHEEKDKIIRGTKPVDLVLFGETLHVNNWQAALREVLNKLIDRDPALFQRVAAKNEKMLSASNPARKKNYEKLNGGFWLRKGQSSEEKKNLLEQAREVYELSDEDFHYGIKETG